MARASVYAHNFLLLFSSCVYLSLSTEKEHKWKISLHCKNKKTSVCELVLCFLLIQSRHGANSFGSKFNDSSAPLRYTIRCSCSLFILIMELWHALISHIIGCLHEFFEVSQIFGQFFKILLLLFNFWKLLILYFGIKHIFSESTCNFLCRCLIHVKQI